MTKPLTRAEIYEHLARLEREGHPRPWEEFEVEWDIWRPIDDLVELSLSIEDGLSIRLKLQLPPMVERTTRYPEPVREAPLAGQQYWSADPNVLVFAYPFTWIGSELDYHRLNRGRIHLTERNARAHGMAEAGCSWEEIEQVLRGGER